MRKLWARATFLRNYSLMRGSETVAFAATQWTLVDLASRKILKIDAVDFGNYWMGDYQELIHEKFRIDKETLTAMQTVGQKEVRYSDLDYNGHMNNTYYLDVLCDYVPELAAGTHRVSFVQNWNTMSLASRKFVEFIKENFVFVQEK